MNPDTNAPLERPMVSFVEEPNHFPAEAVVSPDEPIKVVPEGEELSAEQIMEEQYAFTQGIRMRVVKSLTAKSAVPDENANKMLLVSMLKDMDAQAASRVRIKQDSGAAAGMAGMAAMVTQILRQVDVRSYRLPEAIDVEARTLPSSMTVPSIVPGEMDVNPAQGNIDDFMRKMKTD